MVPTRSGHRLAVNAKAHRGATDSPDGGLRRRPGDVATHPPGQGRDVAVEASSRASGLAAALRGLRPGGVCTGTGYYLAPGTKVPVMDMYATSTTLRVGVSHVRPYLPDALDFVAEHDFPAEKVTSVLADWYDAPEAYAARTTKLVVHRPPLDLRSSTLDA